MLSEYASHIELECTYVSITGLCISIDTCSGLEAVDLTNTFFSLVPCTVNFVFKEIGVKTYKCYIYTPANLGSYGLVVKKEEVFFKVQTYILCI